MAYGMMAPPLLNPDQIGGIAMAPMMAARLQQAQQQANLTRQRALQEAVRARMQPGVIKSQEYANVAPSTFSALANPFFAASQRGALDPTIETMVANLMKNGGPFGGMEAQNIANQAGKGGGLMQTMMNQQPQQQAASFQQQNPNFYANGGEPGINNQQANSIMQHQLANASGTAAPSVVSKSAQQAGHIGLIQALLNDMGFDGKTTNKVINTVKKNYQNIGQQAASGSLISGQNNTNNSANRAQNNYPDYSKIAEKTRLINGKPYYYSAKWGGWRASAQ